MCNYHHFSESQVERAKTYIKFPRKYFPDYLTALSFMHLAHNIDGDIIKSIDYHYFFSVKNGMPEHQVWIQLKDDLINQITYVQHSKLF